MSDAETIKEALRFSVEVEQQLIRAAHNYAVSSDERNLVDRATLAIWALQNALARKSGQPS